MAQAVIPPGKLAVTVTWLVMDARPTRPPRPAPLRKLALMRAEALTLSFYRYLYNTVGEPWLWADRRAMDDVRLAGILSDPRMALYVLYAAGVPAGFVELQRHDPKTTEIMHFGLIPDFIGMGLGAFLLDAAVEIAWQAEPARLHVETCTLDHPRALAVYQRAGFQPYRQEQTVKDDPRSRGLIPRHAAPQHPMTAG